MHGSHGTDFVTLRQHHGVRSVLERGMQLLAHMPYPRYVLNMVALGTGRNLFELLAQSP